MGLAIDYLPLTNSNKVRLFLNERSKGAGKEKKRKQKAFESLRKERWRERKREIKLSEVKKVLFAIINPLGIRRFRRLELTQNLIQVHLRYLGHG